MDDRNVIGRGIEYLRLVIYQTIRLVRPDRWPNRVFYVNLYPLTDQVKIGDLDEVENEKAKLITSRDEDYFYCLLCREDIIEYKNPEDFIPVIEHIVDHQFQDDLQFNNVVQYEITLRDMLMMRLEDSGYSVGDYFDLYMSKLRDRYREKEKNNIE